MSSAPEMAPAAPSPLQVPPPHRWQRRELLSRPRFDLSGLVGPTGQQQNVEPADVGTAARNAQQQRQPRREFARLATPPQGKPMKKQASPWKLRANSSPAARLFRASAAYSVRRGAKGSSPAATLLRRAAVADAQGTAQVGPTGGGWPMGKLRGLLDSLNCANPSGVAEEWRGEISAVAVPSSMGSVVANNIGAASSSVVKQDSRLTDSDNNSSSYTDAREEQSDATGGGALLGGGAAWEASGMPVRPGSSDSMEVVPGTLRGADSGSGSRSEFGTASAASVGRGGSEASDGPAQGVPRDADSASRSEYETASEFSVPPASGTEVSASQSLGALTEFGTASDGSGMVHPGAAMSNGQMEALAPDNASRTEYETASEAAGSLWSQQSWGVIQEGPGEVDGGASEEAHPAGCGCDHCHVAAEGQDMGPLQEQGDGTEATWQQKAPRTAADAAAAAAAAATVALSGSFSWAGAGTMDGAEGTSGHSGEKQAPQGSTSAQDPAHGQNHLVPRIHSADSEPKAHGRTTERRLLGMASKWRRSREVLPNVGAPAAAAPSEAERSTPPLLLCVGGGATQDGKLVQGDEEEEEEEEEDVFFVDDDEFSEGSWDVSSATRGFPAALERKEAASPDRGSDKDSDAEAQPQGCRRGLRRRRPPAPDLMHHEEKPGVVTSTDPSSSQGRMVEPHLPPELLPGEPGQRTKFTLPRPSTKPRHFQWRKTASPEGRHSSNPLKSFAQRLGRWKPRV